MRRLALIVLVACGSSRKAEPVRAIAGDLVIADVTVVPMDRDTTLPHQTVIVRGDKIVAIAPHERVDIGAGATRVDGAGKWLMPGLADMHVHTWSERDLTMFVAAGVTTVRNMYGSEQHLAWKKAIADGKQLGPTLVTASPIIDGDPPVWPGSVVLTKPDEVDGVVAGLKGKGYDFLKPYARLEKPVYDALVAAGKKHGLTLQGHVPKAVGLDHVLASGQRSIEHLDGWFEALSSAEKQPGESYWKTMGRLVSTIDESRIAAFVQQTRQAGAYNCATLIVMARMAELGDVAAVEKQVKWLSFVTPEVRAMWDPKRDFRLRSAEAADFTAMRTANEMRKQIVRVLATAGAPMIVGTDTGNPYVVPGEAMHDEIELLVAAGAPRARVLRAATTDAGTFLGMPGTLGVVAVGARADLLLVGVDPLAAPLPLVPDGVVLRGRWLPSSELEAKLAAIAKPAATDRFADMPPLAPEGKDVIQAHYEVRSGDSVVGEERIAIGFVDGKRVVVAQVVNDVPGHIETTYRIAGQATRVEQKTAFGAIALDAKPAGGKLVAAGKDAAGKAIELSASLPADAFIAGPGIGSSVELADKLAGMKVDEARKLASLELATFPNPAIERATIDVQRKPDVGGNRVFALTMKFGTMQLASELVLDAKGLPVEQTLGAPLNLSFVRR